MNIDEGVRHRIRKYYSCSTVSFQSYKASSMKINDRKYTNKVQEYSIKNEDLKLNSKIKIHELFQTLSMR